MNKLQQKIQLRKIIAKKQLMLINLTGKQKTDIMSQVNEHKVVLAALVRFGTSRAPTVADLIAVLSANEKVDQQDINSELGFKRWALKSAVLDYYIGLNRGVDEKIMDGFSEKLSSSFAPNQEAIYNIWLKKLQDGEKNNLLEDSSLGKTVENGFGRGSNFEKQLERYRENFVKQLWHKLSEE